MMIENFGCYVPQLYPPPNHIPTHTHTHREKLPLQPNPVPVMSPDFATKYIK